MMKQICLIFILFIFSKNVLGNYCIPNPTNGVNGYDLSHLKLQTIDSAYGGTTVYRFFNDSISRFTCYLRPGFTYKIYLTSGSSHASSIAAAWIDWNNDSVFANSTEKLGEKSFTGTVQMDSISFTVPLNCYKGRIRLRVRSSSTASMNACTDYSSGQTTDFIVTTLDPFYDTQFFNGWENYQTTQGYIDGVQLGAITNFSTGDPDGTMYHFYDKLSTNILTCDLNTITVNTIVNLPNTYLNIYCDANEDGHFDDYQDLLLSQNIPVGVNNFSFPITLPAFSGTNRLRVELFNLSSGILDVEDYPVNVLASSPTGVPDAIIGTDMFSDCNAGCSFTGCAGTHVFHDNSCGTPATWEWDVPGATPSTSTAKNPSFTFTTGNYQMTLIVTNAFGSDTAIININIENPFLSFSLGHDTAICGAGSLQLNAPVTQSGCYKYEWTTGETDHKIRVSAAGTYGVYVSNCDNSGCRSFDQINVSFSPLLYNVTGGGIYCTGSGGKSVGLDDSETGVTYRLYVNGNAAGNAVPGTGSAISFGLQTVTGTYTVVATNNALACTATMSGSVNVAAAQLPSAFHVIGGGSYCAGAGGLPVGLDSSQAHIVYQLYRNGSPIGNPVTGTGSSFNFPNHSPAGTYTIVASDTGGSCTTTMTGSVPIIVIPAPAVYNASGGGYFCGSIGADLALSGSQSGVNYELYNNGVATGITLMGNDSAISFTSIANTGVYTVVAMNDSSCTSEMTDSVSFFIKPVPDVFNVLGGGNFCSGGPGMPIYIDTSQTGINYRLYTGGFPLGGVVSGTGTQLQIGTPSVSGTFIVIATNTANACTATMNGVVEENEVPYPQLYSVGGGGHFCAGDSGVEVTLLNSDTGYTYQLQLNGVNTGNSISGNDTLISFGLQNTGGNYTVIGTTDSSQCSTQMLGSADVIEDVCSGINNINSEPDLILYPNPVHDILNIIYSNRPTHNFSINIINDMGENVRRITFDNYRSDKLSIDISDLNDGIYLLSIAGQKGRRFVVERGGK